MPNISRRRFLKTAGAGAAALASVGAASLRAGRALAMPGLIGLAQDTSVDFNNELNVYNEIYGNPPMLGRVHVGNRVSIWRGPSPDSGRVRNVFGGKGTFGSYIAPIYRSVRGEPYDRRWHSTVWFETKDGYMHSSHLLPTREIINEPITTFESEFWGEVTVPEAFQRKQPRLSYPRYDYDHYKLFYSQVHRVVDITTSDDGLVWYRIYDDIEPERQAWVLGRSLRPVALEEFDPISPDVTSKHIDINLGAQLISCYENGHEVFRTQIASGTSLTTPDGSEIDFSTPYGDYHVQRKRPSRRMRGGEAFGLPYDVNGVPWCTYFTYTGAAIHGAYWHNNFGIPRSHGCINVTADAAKWIYRWSQPYLGYDEDYRWVEPGELATTIAVV